MNTQSDVWIYQTIMVQGLIHAFVILLESTLVLATYMIGMVRAVAGMQYRRGFATAFFSFEYKAVSSMNMQYR